MSLFQCVNSVCKIKIALLIVFIFLLISPLQIRAEKWQLDQSISNIKLVGTRILSYRDSGSKEWNVSSDPSEFTVWSDGDLSGRMRVDYASLSMIWTGGDAPFLKQVISYGYNGKQGRIVTHKSGDPNNCIDVKGANLVPGKPSGIDNTLALYETGLAFMPGGFRIAGLDIKSLINGLEIKSSIFSKSDELLDGASVKRIDIGGQGKVPHIATAWIDPNKDNCLVKYEKYGKSSSGQDIVVESGEIQKYVKTSDGYWVPGKVVVEHVITSVEQSMLKRAVDRYRMTIEFGQIEINAPGFDSDIFTVPIPLGYRVHDEAKHAFYISGGKTSKNTKAGNPKTTDSAESTTSTVINFTVVFVAICFAVVVGYVLIRILRKSKVM